MITSTSNPQIKEVVLLQTKAKARTDTGLFIAEGRRLVSEIPAEQLERAYATEAFLASEEGQRLSAALGRRCETVSEAVFEKLSDTRSPQGILAVVKKPEYAREKLLGGPILLLERVQDPGNMGTIFRTAEAAGVTGLILDGDCADPLQPKVVRGTMGAIFRLPFLRLDSAVSAAEWLKTEGYTIYAAHLSGTSFYDELKYPKKTAFLLGNEGNGLTEALTAEADVKLKIPMAGRAESLNVAVAGAVLMYEYFRQHRGSV